MPNSRIIAAALIGAPEQLTDILGPDDLLCVAPELSSVFTVRTTSTDGTQTAMVDLPGSTAFVRLPRSFRLRQITHDGGHFTLTSTDGRSVTGTPRQFSTPYKVIAEEYNPRYEQHLEEAFLATGRLPVDPTPPHTLQLSSPAAERQLELHFDSAGPEKVTDLLPHAHHLASELERIHREGTAFIWSAFAEGDETAEEQSRFPELMVPQALVVYRSGDFELHFEEPEHHYFMAGYWPAVQYRADLTPVHITVES
ncbi:hypothetical protein CFP65_6060 [Kitasatospora sp. MMS16-BH015]|uniref:hypothetical protein n=1 Tax=Kitasatospora sp. MMS16-BH015 TaxID=2018025 RepID=UPI000CA0B146|nr:hypothetical protein [Kitasatospora sp. MMS16-BH015]AUG80731.1 hypothetical protein CFP65_6060 [Kitasatospora sp. MMS16-BH015]